MSGNPYNGFSWSDRMAKYKEMQRRISAGELAAPRGPCELCSQPALPDGSITFEYHDENYGQEYKWIAPDAYVLCRNCHIYRIHQRFVRCLNWRAFLAHVRRGGYASELKLPAIKAEIASYQRALQAGLIPPSLAILRPYKGIVGREWFTNLSLAPHLRPGQPISDAS